MTSAKHTIGIIGLGSIGRRHATNLYQKLGQTEVIGYDIELTDKVGWVCGDLDFLLKNATAFVIASPTDMHLKHMEMCKGKPIFVEKPIADGKFVHPSWWNSDLNSVLMVGYNLRFHPCVQKAKEWISNDIGYPEWANFVLAQHSVKPPYLRDGVILNWSHEIDLALHLLGDGSVMYSSTRLVSGRDDLTDILFKHKSGCRSLIHLDYVTQPEVRQSIVTGTSGTVILDLVGHNAWLRDLDGQIIDHVTAEGGWDETFIAEMRAFLNMLDGNLDNPGCTADEGMKVLDICLQVRKQAGL